MKKVLILGASGLLGLNLALKAQDSYEVLGHVHQHSLHKAPFPIVRADLIDETALHKTIGQSGADFVINCVALADLEACEREPIQANTLNNDLAGRVARICISESIDLAQLSTDAVFDGEKGNYREEDEANPLSVYARSKYEGEQSVQEANPDALIARVNFFGWSLNGQRSLAEFFYNNLAEGRAIKGLTDRFFNPLHASHLSEILLKLLEMKKKGIVHIGSPVSISKYDFGVAIAKQFDLDVTLIAKSKADELGYSAARSPRLTMNVEKLSAALNEELPDVHAGISTLHAQFETGYRDQILAMAGENELQANLTNEVS